MLSVGHGGDGETWCDADPFHAVVFYDEKNAPVAEILVSFDCETFVTLPGLTHRGAFLTRDEAWLFADACRLHDVGACPAPGQTRIAQRPFGRQFSSVATRRVDESHRALARPHGIPEERRVRDVTRAERYLFCAWLHVGTPYDTPHQGKRRDGQKWKLDDVNTSLEKRQADMLCDATIGDLTACVRSRLDRPLAGQDA